MKRSIVRSLCASSIALFTFLVTAAAALAADQFALPQCSPAPAPALGTCQPGGISPGPDGALWFAEENGNKIGRITTGGAIVEFTNGLAGSAAPVEIVAGPDGRLWFTESGNNKIGAITTGGAIGRASCRERVYSGV